PGRASSRVHRVDAGPAELLCSLATGGVGIARVQARPRQRKMRDDRMITVVGESLVDVVARTGHDELTVHPGGSPANVAVALSRLGQRTALVTQIGADDYGALIRTHLEGNGVEVILAGPAGQPTSRALATLDAQGAASYEFDLSWDVRGLRLAEGSAAVH